MKNRLLILFLSVSCLCAAQQSTLDFYGGLANYQGDLQAKRYTFKLAKPAFGLGASHQIGAQLSVRAALLFAQVEGDDKFQKNADLKLRNLRFYSNITEFHVGLQYMLMDIYAKKYSPYIFAGMGVFKFDPYIYDKNDNKIYLRPLTTEGQGLYPNKKIYKTTQLNIPFGAGFKYSVNENFDMGIELGARKLFTDYLDDVSTSYSDYFTLKFARGQMATDYAFRADEVQPLPYPAGGTKRGSPRYKDWYYLTTITVSYKFGGEPLTAGSGNGSVGKKYRKGAGCPRMKF
ncbi:MAG: outer membrane beta-barrel protein [Sphingobacteriales bacterium]|nr:outer membrane beta-barrel protein [Sphingobacteriales bacterium]